MLVERGWSVTYRHKLWRLLARRIPLRPFPLSGPSAVASITFDDVPDSAVSVGAQLLGRSGAAGTFYIAAGTCEFQDRHWRVCSRDQIRDLTEGGHEVGCHTAHHVNVQSLGVEALARECDENARTILEITGYPLLNFAYPFGDLGLWQARYLVQRFQSCRTIYERINVGTIDLAKVGAIGLFDRTMTRDRLEDLVGAAVAAKGWLVFYTHDVGPEPTFMGTSPRLMELTLSVLADHGVPCVTMEAALRHHGYGEDRTAPSTGARSAEI
ncbi:polysaccharide deacetylase family protein [Enterovirga rhinocerotis]|uniref:Chitooligosaccharide deacetylase n=1 Tax=Enterovirga rhinocerotis TaxID=1339210 RepID=A0A4R7C9F9_9HYPH|nr:polysaccharide deacetylase family protein [Enterovirga rhinocerotis]TDR95041.1 polysaccharide deacetylase [Enterovirga rhinocerotis]